MAPPKRFTSRRGDAEPKQFVLDYERETVKDGETVLVPEEASFTAVAVAPAGVMLDFTATADGDGARSAGALTDLLAGVLVDEDVERFMTLVHDKKALIDINVLGDVVMWLASEYVGGRPTLPS